MIERAIDAQARTAGDRREVNCAGQSGLRTGMTKVGLPGATLGLQKEDPTVAELLKPLGYATGQFGKNHLGDRNEFLPTVHGFDEFYGNLYHLSAEEEPKLPDYPKSLDFRAKYDREACWTVRRWTRTIRPLIRASPPLSVARPVAVAPRANRLN
jgi:arylsulfatase A-like enzyme